jgi:hypothetical protein
MPFKVIFPFVEINRVLITEHPDLSKIGLHYVTRARRVFSYPEWTRNDTGGIRKDLESKVLTPGARVEYVPDGDSYDDYEAWSAHDYYFEEPPAEVVPQMDQDASCGKRAFEKVIRTAGKVKQAASFPVFKALELFQYFYDKVKESLAKNMLKQAVFEATKRLKTQWKIVFGMTLVCTVGYVLTKYGAKAVKSLAAAATTLMPFLSRGSKAEKEITAAEIEEFATVVAQAGEEDTGSLNLNPSAFKPSYSARLCGVLTLWFAGLGATGKNILVAAKHVNPLVSAGKHGIGFMKYMLKHFPAAVQGIVYEITGFNALEKEACYAVVLDMMRLRQIYAANGNTVLGMDFVEDVILTMKKANAMEATLVSSTDKTRDVFTKIKSEFEYLYQESLVFRGLASIRQVPVCAYFFGKAGIGKSHAMSRVFADVLRDNGDTTIYSRSAGGRYWDGYTNQNGVLIEEFGNMSAFDECLEVLQMVSVNPMILNMANIEAKGRFFRSTFVAMSTNKDPRTQFKSVVDKEAFARRIIPIQVILKRAYQKKNGKLDSDKLLGSGGDFQHLDFQISDEDGHVKSYDYRAMIAFLRAQYLVNGLVYKAAVEDLHKDCAARKGTPDPLFPCDEAKTWKDPTIIKVQAKDDEDCPKIEPMKLMELKTDETGGGFMSSIFEATREPSSAIIETGGSCGKLDCDDGKCEAPKCVYLRALDKRVAEGVCKCDPESVLGDYCCDKSRKHIEEYMAFTAKENMATALRRQEALFPSEVLDQLVASAFTRNHPVLSAVLSVLSTVVAVAAGFKIALTAIKFVTNLFGKPEKSVTKSEVVESVVPVVEETIVDSQSNYDKQRDRDEDESRIYDWHDYGHDEVTARPKEIGPGRRVRIRVQSDDEKFDKRMAQYSVIQAKVAKNMADIYLNGRKVGFGIFVKNGKLLMPYHFVAKEMETGIGSAQIRVVRAGETKDVCVSKVNLRTLAKEDGYTHDMCCLDVEMATTVRAIDSYFLPEETIRRKYELIQETELVGTANVNKAGVGRLSLEKTSYTAKGNQSLFVTSKYKYQPQIPGDCGRVLMTPSVQGVLGFHVYMSSTGFDQHGAAALLTRECVGKLLGQVEVEPQAITNAVSDDYVFLGENGALVSIGKIDAPVTAPMKSRLVESVFRSEAWCAPTKFPAVLGPDHPTNPGHTTHSIVYSGLLRQSKGVKEIIDPDLEYAVDSVVEDYRFRKGVRDLLTISEVINSSERFPGLGTMCMSTSSGYPWAYKGLGSKKGAHFSTSFNRDRVVTNPELLEEVSLACKDVEQGFRTNAIWSMFPKDEVRSQTRIETAHTRVVCASPMHMTMVFRRYFGAFLSMFHIERYELESCVGMNVNSSDWDLRVKRLLAVSDVGFDGDYTQFEMLGTVAMHRRVGKVINAWYGENCVLDNKVRLRLLEESATAVVRIGNSLFGTSGSNKSGSVLTTVINTLINVMMIRFAYVSLMKRQRPDISSINCFKRYVAHDAFGDDGRTAVHSEVREWFNGPAIARLFEQYDIVFTSGDKDKEFAMKKIVDCTFLKARTNEDCHFIPGIRYYPKANEQAVVQSLSFRVNTMSPLEHARCLTEDTLRRVFGSGKEVFQLWHQRLWKVAAEHGYSFNLLNFEDLVFEWTNRIFVCEFGTLRLFDPLIETQMTDETGVPVDVSAPVMHVAAGAASVPVSDYGGLRNKANTVSDTLKKFTAVVDVPAGDDQNIARNVAESLLPRSTGVICQTPLEYFGKMYLCYFGSLRYKTICEDHRDGVSSIGYFSADLIVQKNSMGALAGTGTNFGPVAVGGKVLEVQVPYVSIFPFLIVPRTKSQIDDLRYSFGAVGFTITRASGKGAVYEAAGDGFRLFRHCFVPRLSVTGFSRAHEGLPYYVPSLIRLVPGIVTLTMTQNQLSSIPVVDISPRTNASPIDWLVIESRYLSNFQLIQCGLPIGLSQPRRYVESTHVANVFITNWRTIFNSVRIDPEPIPDGQLETFGARPIGEVITTGTGQVLARTYFVVRDNDDDENYKTWLGVVPSSSLVVSCLTDASLKVSNKASVVVAGRAAREWSFNKYFAEVDEVIPQAGDGIVFSSAAEVSKGASETFSGTLSIGEASMSDIQAVERQQFLGEYKWSTNDAPGAVMLALDVPLELMKNRLTTQAFKRNVFWRGDSVLSIHLQTTQFNSGRFVVLFVPLLPKAEAIERFAASGTNQSMVPYVNVDANSSKTIDFVIPYFSQYTHVNTFERGSSSSLGTLLFIVKNPLYIGDSLSSGLVYTLFSRFENSQFSVVNPTLTTIVPQGGLNSKVTNINIRKVVDSTIDASSTGDNFEAKAQFTKNDKPNLGLNYTPVRTADYPMLCNASNVEYAENLSLDSSTIVGLANSVAGTMVDEMDFGFLKDKPCFIGTFAIRANSLANEQIYSRRLCPLPELFSAVEGEVFQPDLLGYVSAPFYFWKGSLKFRFEFVATAFHTCRVAFCAHYSMPLDSVLDEDALSQYTIIHDIGVGQNDITVTFPWRSSTPWKRVPNSTRSEESDCCLGYMSVRVINPLNPPDSVAPFVEVNVFSMAGEDFELSGFGNASQDLQSVL